MRTDRGETQVLHMQPSPALCPGMARRGDRPWVLPRTGSTASRGGCTAPPCPQLGAAQRGR